MLCKKCKKEIEADSIYCRFCGKKQLSETIERKKQKRPNGTGTIVKLSGSRAKPFNARKYINGKIVSIGTYATRTEAVIALNEANSKNLSSMYDATVEQIFNIVIEQNKGKLSESGLTNYRSGYLHLSHLAKMKMRDFRTHHIQDAISTAQANGIGYATWKKIQNISSLMCKIAMANDLIDKNYAQLVNMPEQKKKPEKPSFTDSQLSTLWDIWESDEHAAAILALCYNGLRVNEFLDLKKEHIDIEQRIIFAPGSKTEAGKNRIIAIPIDVLPIYEKMMCSKGEYLYPSPTGKRWDAKNYRDRIFHPTLDKYALDPQGKLTPHSCRHTYAMLCVRNELNQKATMDLMGHSKYSTTLEIYADGTAKDLDFLRNEADKLRRQ
jgi:integrase